MVAQGVDGVVVQVELGETWTGGERAVGERRQKIGAQSENAEGGQDRRITGGHLWNLSRVTSIKTRSLGCTKGRLKPNLHPSANSELYFTHLCLPYYPSYSVTGNVLRTPEPRFDAMQR